MFVPYLLRTADYGRTWTNIATSLPNDEVIRTLREDTRNPNLLFIGTETGIWYSLNAGKNWTRCMPGLPTVSVYDLLIHPRDGDLIAATHGRSLWILDDITPLQQMNAQVEASDAWLFSQRPATLWNNLSRGGQRGHFWFAGENPPSVTNTGSLPRAEFANNALIHYYVGKSSTDSLLLEISDMSGRQSRKVSLPANPGIHRFVWDLRFDAQPYTPEEYARVDGLFQELIARYPMNALTQAYAAFKKASSPDAQRRVVDNLSRGIFSLALPAGFGLPTAQAGTYLLTLRSGDQVWKQTLQVRTDPMNK